MTHRACRSRARTGHLTATGPVPPTRSRDRWGRAETQRTALGEALVIRRRTRVRFPPPPPWGFPRKPGIYFPKPGLEEPAARPRGARSDDRAPRASWVCLTVSPLGDRPCRGRARRLGGGGGAGGRGRAARRGGAAT